LAAGSRGASAKTACFGAAVATAAVAAAAAVAAVAVAGEGGDAFSSSSSSSSSSPMSPANSSGSAALPPRPGLFAALEDKSRDKETDPDSALMERIAEVNVCHPRNKGLFQITHYYGNTVPYDPRGMTAICRRKAIGSYAEEVLRASSHPGITKLLAQKLSDSDRKHAQVKVGATRFGTGFDPNVKRESEAEESVTSEASKSVGELLQLIDNPACDSHIVRCFHSNAQRKAQTQLELSVLRTALEQSNVLGILTSKFNRYVQAIPLLSFLEKYQSLLMLEQQQVKINESTCSATCAIKGFLALDAADRAREIIERVLGSKAISSPELTTSSFEGGRERTSSEIEREPLVKFSSESFVVAVGFVFTSKAIQHSLDKLYHLVVFVSVRKIQGTVRRRIAYVRYRVLRNVRGKLRNIIEKAEANKHSTKPLAELSHFITNCEKKVRLECLEMQRARQLRDQMSSLHSLLQIIDQARNVSKKGTIVDEYKCIENVSEQANALGYSNIRQVLDLLKRRDEIKSSALILAGLLQETDNEEKLREATEKALAMKNKNKMRGEFQYDKELLIARKRQRVLESQASALERCIAAMRDLLSLVPLKRFYLAQNRAASRELLSKCAHLMEPELQALESLVKTETRSGAPFLTLVKNFAPLRTLVLERHVEAAGELGSKLQAVLQPCKTLYQNSSSRWRALTTELVEMAEAELLATAQQVDAVVCIPILEAAVKIMAAPAASLAERLGAEQIDLIHNNVEDIDHHHHGSFTESDAHMAHNMETSSDHGAPTARPASPSHEHLSTASSASASTSASASDLSPPATRARTNSKDARHGSAWLDQDRKAFYASFEQALSNSTELLERLHQVYVSPQRRQVTQKVVVFRDLLLAFALQQWQKVTLYF
jgi:hypothetical protein